MNIYKVKRTDRIKYDQYDSFICYAKNENSAVKMLPREVNFCTPEEEEDYNYWINAWWTTNPENISVEYVGMCLDVDEESIILASFNAG